jgi:predicted nucleotidyltransferase
MTPREMEIKSLIRAAPLLAGHQVVLFGSRARGDASDRSDFDLGVDGDTPLELDRFFAITDFCINIPCMVIEAITSVDSCGLVSSRFVRATTST